MMEDDGYYKKQKPFDEYVSDVVNGEFERKLDDIIENRGKEKKKTTKELLEMKLLGTTEKRRHFIKRENRRDLKRKHLDRYRTKRMR